MLEGLLAGAVQGTAVLAAAFDDALACREADSRQAGRDRLPYANNHRTTYTEKIIAAASAISPAGIA